MNILQRYIIEPFAILRNRTFAKLYMAQTVSQLGDAFAWVGLALLAYHIDEARSPVILSVTLTLRVAAYIVFSPFAGVLADKIDRKKILYVTHFARMGIITCFPFVTAEWQMYVLVFLLNMFAAFFTPTYRSVIPQVVEKERYREAIGLSMGTFQLLGVAGPALAGILAVWLGAREIFFVNTVTFIVAAVFILAIPKAAIQKQADTTASNNGAWKDVQKGVRLLFGNKILRFALSIEFISAIAGAQILVNTVGHVKNGLHLTDSHYGWVMAAFGIGAAIAAYVAGIVDKSKTRSRSLIGGAFLVGTAILFANYSSFNMLLFLWVLAGLGQSLADTPSETLIGENISMENQGKVYGSHFAFSHLWWAIAYPVAGLLGNTFPDTNFLYGGLLTLGFALAAVMIFRPKGD